MEYGGGEYGKTGDEGGEYGKPGGSGGGGTMLTRYDIHDLNAGLVPDYPLKNGWDDISLYYAKALQKMGYKQNPAPGDNVETMWTFSQKPTDYYFQAAMHWTPKYPGTPPPPQDRWWNHCTHEAGKTPAAESFFLPWHRAYIYWFEVIIRSYVADLGGPDGWALPYWNYSYYDASDPNGPWPRAKLPDVFTKPKLPDGTGNPLYIPDRAKRGLQPGFFLRVTTPYYYQAYGSSDYIFFNQNLDFQPHGVVHGNVGVGEAPGSPTGWMQSTIPASFDPVFFLHHSEIDRFWVGWLTQPGRSNPTDPGWLNATNDPEYNRRWNFWRDGNINNVINVYPEDMVDNEHLGPKFPYSYRYATMPQIPAPRPPGPQARQTLEAAPAAEPAAQLASPLDLVNAQLAASEGPVKLGPEPVTALVPLSEEAEPQLAALDAAPEEPPLVVLHLDGISAKQPAGNYEVYMNYPDADKETAGEVPHYVGVLPSFGAEHGGHEGHEHGLSADYDITEIVSHLRQAGDWDPSKASVTFVPVSPLDPEHLKAAEMTVGSMSIHSS